MKRNGFFYHFYLDTLDIKLQNCNGIASGGLKQKHLLSCLAFSHEENGYCPDTVVMYSAFTYSCS